MTNIMETITIDKEILIDLSKNLEEMQLKLESLELMNDKEFMDSLDRSKEQIVEREFVDFNEL